MCVVPLDEHDVAGLQSDRLSIDRRRSLSAVYQLYLIVVGVTVETDSPSLAVMESA